MKKKTMKKNSLGYKVTIYYSLPSVEAKEVFETYFSKMGVYC